MNKLKDAEETGSPQWRTFGYLGICRDMQNPVTYSDGFYNVSDRDLAIRAVNSYEPHRAVIAELVDALEKTWGIMKYGPVQSGHIEVVESLADAALTRAKEALK